MPQGSWALPGINLSQGPGSAPAVVIAEDGETTLAWTNGEGVFFVTRPPGGTFSAPMPVTTDAYYARPALTVSPNGSVTVAWMDRDGSVSAASRTSGGSFGPAEQISPANLDNEDFNYYSYDLQAASTDETTTVSWISRSGETPYVQASTRNEGGSFSDPVNLSPSAEVNERAATGSQLAMAEDGTATIVWAQSESSGSSILASTQPPGGSFGNPVTLGGGGRYPQIAISRTGTTLVAWSGKRDGYPKILTAWKSAHGAFSLPRDFASTGSTTIDGDGDYYVAGAAFADDGTATVAADLYRTDAISAETMTREHGQSFSRPTELRGSEGSSISQLSVGADGTANVMLTGYGEYDGVEIRASTRLPGGSFTDPVELDDYASSDAVAATGSGGLATAAWTIGGLGKYDYPEVVTASTAPDREFCDRTSLRLGRFRVNRKTGIGRLDVVTGTQGRLAVERTAAVNGWQFVVRGAGSAALKVKVKGKAARKLRKRGKVKVRVVVRFSPGFDCDITTRAKVVQLMKGRR